MKSVIAGEKEHVEKYPRLLRYTGAPSNKGKDNFILLETAPQTGMVVWAAPGAAHKVGTYHDKWSTEGFPGGGGYIPFSGTLHLIGD